jgi:hypothetical protein
VVLNIEGKNAADMWCKTRTGWDQASSRFASSIEIWTVQYAGRDTFHVTELFVTWPRSALKRMKWETFALWCEYGV